MQNRQHQIIFDIFEVYKAVFHFYFFFEDREIKNYEHKRDYYVL
jgi:hypothetical protein